VRPIFACALLICAAPASAAPKAEVVLTNDWRKVVTKADKSRLLRWRAALIKAVTAANQEGQTEAITREGVLLQPDAGLERPTLPLGNYQCRTIKLGRNGTYTKAISVRPTSRCTIAEKNGRMRLATLNGSQRAKGNIFPGNDRRQIFLGTMALGDETRAMEYSRDATRDMAGVLERIGDQRWRILLPEPGFESMIDVIELTPGN
jgi:Domain of unknown function (DUF4893)